MYDALQYALKKSSDNLYERLMEMEKVLLKYHFPPMSGFWKRVLREFYHSGKLRLVARVGRRGGKSSTMCRVAVAEALWGDHVVPPGDVGVFAIVSIDRDEAKKKIVNIIKILEALKIPHKATAEEVRLLEKPIVFKVYTASYRTSVGFTCIGLIADEVARWRDDETGSNPATEIFRSMRPAMATMENAHEFMISSPFSSLDAHFEHFGLGDTPQQMVCWAPTWVAHPKLTEEVCRRLEEDEETFQREYGAVPMRAGVHTFFDPYAIEESVIKGWQPSFPRELDQVVAGADFGFRSDFSCLYISHLRGGVYHPGGFQVIKPQPGQPLSPKETVSGFAKLMQQHQTFGLMADGHYQDSIVEYLRPFNIAFIRAPTDVPKTYVRARTLFNQDKVRIPDDKQLVRDLREVQRRPTASGGVRIILPKRAGGGHADLVSALILALWQRAGKEIPAKKEGKKHDWSPSEIREVAELEALLKGEQDDPEWLTSY